MECPICGETFKDGRGLHGHLRFKEGLQGEELDEVYQEAKDMQDVREKGETSSRSETLPLYATHDPAVRRAMQAIGAYSQACLNKGMTEHRLKLVDFAKPLNVDDMNQEAWGKVKQAFREEDAAAQTEMESYKHKVQNAIRALTAHLNGG